MNRTIKQGICFALALLWLAACSKNEIAESRVPLQVDSYYPNSGKGGTLVTILGDGFGTDVSEQTVSFAGTAAEVLSAKGTELVVRTPENGNTGTITLTRGSSTIEVGDYTYQRLSVQGISPQRAQVSSHIRIRGEGFGSLASPGKVRINGTDATVISATDTLVVAEVPDGSGTGPVEVIVDGMEATGPLFTYMAIREVKPLTGGVGTRVTIIGDGFDEIPANNVVTFAGTRTEVLEASATQLVVMVPAEAQTGAILLRVEDEPVNGPDFTLVPPPTIELVTPLSGPAGTEMVIKGQTFSTFLDENKVYINGVEVTVQSATATELRLTIPGGTGSGKVEVVVNDQGVEGPDFLDQNLGIVSLSPDNGLAGTEVTITGTGFSSTASENVVTFNGVQALVTDATSTSLTLQAPADFSTGIVRVSVGGLEAISSVEFRRAGVTTLASGATGLDIASTGGSIAVDDDENVYVLEVSNQRIVKITPDGQVSVLAGSGSMGDSDGQGSAASFRMDIYSGLVFNSQTQRLFLSDAGSVSIRSITLQGEVNTLINSGLVAIGKLGLRENGDIYVLRSGTINMWLISPGMGTYTSIPAGYTIAATRNVRPAIDAAGNVYNRYNAAPTYSHRIISYIGATYTRNLSFAGSTASGYVDGIGTAARFNTIQGMTALDAQNLAVIDAGNFALRQVNTNTAAVSTIVKGESGFQDGDFRNTRFSNAVWDLTVSRDGSAVYLLDCGNNAVRKVMLR